ncbi:MAG: RagB/SusD family nutrient uptake outer membrane protein, partial [Prevotella sp.]|nr:RagB/SusD family nutrient uptake outer membrane protein [Prevotella sp.]
MKTIKYIIMSVVMLFGFASCNDYLEVYEENVEPTDLYWSSKADVEATLSAGYWYLRNSVETYLIPWGELRAGCLFNRSGSPLQTYQIKSTTNITTWSPMYQIINSANLVLKNCDLARSNDATYTQEEMNSHKCEAYWLRALAYFYIVRNWRDAPLFTEPFETDEISYNVAKSSETEIIAQIKADLEEAIRLGAAKTSFNTTWETKGRATIWAIYALMTDVCMWNSDFEQAINYANLILNATASDAPRFMKTATHSSWFTIFNPGNSNESIFELQWSHEKYQGTAQQTNNLPILFDNTNDGRAYELSNQMLQDFNAEYRGIVLEYGEEAGDMAVRTMYGGYFVGSSAAAYTGARAG